MPPKNGLQKIQPKKSIAGAEQNPECRCGRGGSLSTCPFEKQKLSRQTENVFSSQFCTSLSSNFFVKLGDLKITSTSPERQKRSGNLAPVLVIISGNSLVFSRKIITSTGFYRCCAPGASAPVVVKNQSPRNCVF